MSEALEEAWAFVVFVLKFLAPIVLTIVGIFGLAFLLSSCSPTIKYVCPSLSPVPNSTLDALASTGKRDPSTAAWVVDLDRHYQKLDVCRP